MSKETVAMLLAKKGIIPPNEWEHDKFITNKFDLTIAEILSYGGIIPLPHWMISKDEN